MHEVFFLVAVWYYHRACLIIWKIASGFRIKTIKFYLWTRPVWIWHRWVRNLYLGILEWVEVPLIGLVLTWIILKKLHIFLYVCMCVCVEFLWNQRLMGLPYLDIAENYCLDNLNILTLLAGHLRIHIYRLKTRSEKALRKNFKNCKYSIFSGIK